MDHVENFRTAIQRYVKKNGKVDTINDENTVQVGVTLLFLNIFGHASKGTAKQIVEEELICSICLDLVIDARITNCNHLFCSSCLERWFLETQTHLTACPYCKTRISRHRRDRNLDKIIENVMSKYDLSYKAWLRHEKRRRWIQMMELQTNRKNYFWDFVQK